MIEYEYMNRELPDYFKPILWSYSPGKIDLEKDKKTIIVNAINYGDLKHWRWLKENYGEDAIRKILMTIPATEIKERARRLASIIFSITSFNYAPRGTH